MSKLMSLIYMAGFIGTFAKLTFFDGYVYTATNWIIALPVNGFLSAIWPVYWFILYPFYVMTGVQQMLRGG